MSLGTRNGRAVGSRGWIDFIWLHASASLSCLYKHTKQQIVRTLRKAAIVTCNLASHDLTDRSIWSGDRGSERLRNFLASTHMGVLSLLLFLLSRLQGKVQEYSRSKVAGFLVKLFDSSLRQKSNGRT